MQGRNLDYPVPLHGYMAKYYLAQVQEDARQLEAQLRDTDQIPAWTLTKLATGSDRINAAARYLLHKLRNPPAYGDAVASAATLQEAARPDIRAFIPQIVVAAAALYVVGMAVADEPPPRRASKPRSFRVVRKGKRVRLP